MISKESLANKYRPRNVDDIVGQEQCKLTLHSLMSKSFGSRVFLFHSTLPGVGKTTAARILAKIVNCANTEGGPCKDTLCKYCQMIEDGRTPDIEELNFANERGIDAARDLVERSQYMPSSLRHRVYILDEFHQATVPAQNTLLKLFEDTPEYVYFVLCTTSVNSVIPTIRSRCTKVEFGPVSIDALTKHINVIATKENIIVEPDGVAIIAESSGGSVRNALVYLEQCGRAGAVTESTATKAVGFVEDKLVNELIEILVTANKHKFFQYFSKIAKQKINIRDVCRKASKSCIDLSVDTNFELYAMLTELLDAANLAPTDEQVYTILYSSFHKSYFVPITKDGSLDNKMLTNYVALTSKVEASFRFVVPHIAMLDFGNRIKALVVGDADEAQLFIKNLSALNITHYMLKSSAKDIMKSPNKVSIQQLLIQQIIKPINTK